MCPVNLDDIRKRREERRQAMLAAAKEEESSNGKQPAEAVEEKPEDSSPGPTPPMERRRRTTRDKAVAERQAAKPEPAVTQEGAEEEELVDTVQVDGKTMAVYEAPKPEILEATGADDTLVAKVVAEVRKAVREEFSKLRIHFDIGAQSQIRELAEGAMQSLQQASELAKRIEKPERKPRQSKERQPESEGYKKFKAEWRALDKAGRVAYAEKVGAKWEAHPDDKIDAMRMQVAVREAMGVEKY